MKLSIAALLALTASSIAAACPNKLQRRQDPNTSDSPAPTSPDGPYTPSAPSGVPVLNGTATSNQTIASPTPASVLAANVQSTVLIFARDTASAYSAYSGLNGYAIPYEVVIVPQSGATLPQLVTGTTGNYGAIVVLSEVSYNFGAIGFQSALTAEQWAQLYQYQVDFGVRMVRIDVYPGPNFGTTAVAGGCCDSGVEQLISITSTSAFPTSGMNVGAGVSTAGLWHYPASITNSSIATEFASFAPTFATNGTMGTNSSAFTTKSTAGVINNFGDRQQMVFFISWATDWAQTSNYLQHAWIHWATRGLYTGYRRVNLGTQIDDMFLASALYRPLNTNYRVTPADLDHHRTWTISINRRLPPGSVYFLEIAHNGNGNIEASQAATGGTQCGIGPIEYAEQFDTPLEWKKTLGTGVNLWPATPTSYPYKTTCLNGDPLKVWFNTPGNLNAFAHLSHTFTHEDENNATYFDISREISWNTAWLAQSGIAKANKFSPKGIVPPAITGLNNGDAQRAWKDNGIVNVVGDNTRPALMNTQNEHWPLISTAERNGFAGIQITPRWATSVYYNCDLPACTVQEWIDTSGGKGDWNTLLNIERTTNTRHLLGLRRDPYMFHQANMNYVTAGSTTINGVTQKLSMVEAWVETVVQEMMRLTTWPIITLKHDDIATAFAGRVVRDNCVPKLTWKVDPVTRSITGLTLTTNGNTCANAIPVTVPGPVTSTAGHTTEKLGSDPLTIWVKMTGSPVTFTLSNPIAY
ncbi:hypothetical protein PVAG01_03974 [Phlyctema vagabunda]|uniref:Extracellular serine-rich protein n=1 Tax=Phlyctema vagabunda TaxID=108571 RepID=A0ABR4PMX7_9HELO